MHRIESLAALALGLIIYLPALSYGGAADVLKPYEKLSGKEREAKLIEAARREGKVVYYGTIAVDQSSPLLDAFRARYPFLKPEYYRSGNFNVYNKVKTEAAAGNYTADVVDLRAGETYALVKDGLVDPDPAPVRNGIM